jgi:cytochrome c oxidase subunit II
LLKGPIISPSPVTRGAAFRFARVNVAWVAALCLPGCRGDLSTLDPAGPHAASIASLWWVMFYGAVILFALVCVLLAFAFLRPGIGRRAPPSLWLVGGGLVLPAVVLTPLMIYALWTGERLLFRPADGGVTQVDVLARQWEWSFTYRKADGSTHRSVNVLHIPAGQKVRLNVTSADVIHSFWVPRLAGKIDAIPGHSTVLRLSADAPGMYRGLCAEFCGVAHLEMQMTVQAHASLAEYEAAIAALPPVASLDRNTEGREP